MFTSQDSLLILLTHSLKFLITVAQIWCCTAAIYLCSFWSPIAVIDNCQDSCGGSYYSTVTGVKHKYHHSQLITLKILSVISFSEFSRSKRGRCFLTAMVRRPYLVLIIGEYRLHTRSISGWSDSAHSMCLYVSNSTERRRASSLVCWEALQVHHNISFAYWYCRTLMQQCRKSSTYSVSQ